jgi:GNAT superfamily N-acetyltransferase
VIFEMPLTEETRDIHVAYRTKKMLEAEAAAANRGIPQEEPTKKAFSFKAVDTATGEIVGLSRWTIYYQDEPVTNTIEEEAMSFLTPALPQVRTKALYAFRMCLERIGRKSVALPPLKEGEDLNSVKMLSKRVYLDVLAVDPSHQGQGIGKALLQWGLDEADRLGLVTFLESTNEGRPLYDKYGFEPTTSDTLDVTPFGLEGALTHTVRLPLSSLCSCLIADKVTGHGQTTQDQKLRVFNVVLHRQKKELHY